jgi:hypothetical protein
MKSISFAAALLVVSASAFSQDTSVLSRVAPALEGLTPYAVGGTAGYGLGLMKHVSPAWTVRGEWLGATWRDTATSGDLRFSGDANARGGGLFADYRPYRGNFRVVGGVTLRGSSATLLAEPAAGNFVINGTEYAAAGESIKMKMKYPSTMPYLGLGWGYSPYGYKGLSIGVDFGFSFGKPTGSMTFSSGLSGQAGAANIAAEQAKFARELDKVSYFPSMKVGVAYAF